MNSIYQMYAKAELNGGEENGKISGIASAYGVQDSDGDIIDAGAFGECLANVGHVKMYLNHDFGKSTAGLPIGRWTKFEDRDGGLYVEGELNLDLQSGRDVYASLKHGDIDGLSVGFSVAPSDIKEDENGIPHMTKIAKLFEISLCAFPANPEARVQKVKSSMGPTADVLGKIAETKTLSDIEQILRDGGFVKAEAAALISAVKRCQKSADDCAPKITEETATKIAKLFTAISK